jgi:tetratricopeptide (TPR) repeat protein
MRHPNIMILCPAGGLALAGCENPKDAEVERAIEAVNAIDESNLSGLMLNSTDAANAVTYFRRASAQNPDRLDLKRGLAKSMVRNRQVIGAVPIWADIVAHPEAINEDWLGYADALIRDGDWEGAEAALDAVPPTFETFQRYRLEAMVADSNQEWKRSDSYYEVAMGLTTQPAGILNNWGYSKLSRGDYSGAERLFAEALTYDPNLFTAKNNIALARGAQRNYQLPVVAMSQVERAQLLYSLALSAVKQGDVAIGMGLMREAIDTHPQHFEAAVRSLRALETSVVN